MIQITQVHVIDTGKIRENMYDLASELTCLTTTSISKACATQRSGRAGRVQNGFCYRLYSFEQFEVMNEYATPEICRTSLADVCLKVKMLTNKTSIEEFLLKAIQPPSKEQITCGINILKNINALDSYENMTDLGNHLAHMPIDCLLGKIILYALFLRCLDPVLTIVSALSLKDPFVLPIAHNDHPKDNIKKEFSENSLSDHKVLYNTYTAWHSHTDKDKFCAENSISNSNMTLIKGVKTVLMRHLKKTGYITEESGITQNYNDNALNWPVIKACLTAGLYRKYFFLFITLDFQYNFKIYLKFKIIVFNYIFCSKYVQSWQREFFIQAWQCKTTSVINSVLKSRN